MTSSVRATAQNRVTVTYHLTLPDHTVLKGEQTCSTGQGMGADAYYTRKADGKDQKGNPIYYHMWDPDAQLMDWLAAQVFAHYGNNAASYSAGAGQTTGTISVVDDQGPCHSCRSVLTQFKREFPLVTITVRYATGDPNRPTRPAGTGAGIYGYDQGAVHEGGGWWSKTL
jgi:hypothetical protein